MQGNLKGFLLLKKKSFGPPSKVAMYNQKHYALTFNALWIEGSSTMHFLHVEMLSLVYVVLSFFCFRPFNFRCMYFDLKLYFYHVSIIECWRSKEKVIEIR
jgi:hypothetical protein